MSDNIMYRISRWCNFFEKNEILAIFHSLTFELLFLDISSKNVLKQLIKTSMKENELRKQTGDKIFNLLKKNSFIVSEETDDLKTLFTIREKLAEVIKPSILYLLLVDGCNLKCRYCFEDVPETVGKFIPKMMSPDNTKKALNYFAKLIAKYGSKKQQTIIHLYGGEPMMNPKAVKTAVLYSQKLKKKGLLSIDCEIAIVTNGTLIDENFAKFFAENNITVGLSIDGPRHINNAYRIAKDDQIDVFKKIKSCYKLLQKHEVKIGFSATMSPDAIENFDEVLNFFVNDIGIPDGICFNILHYNPLISVNTEYFEKTAKSLIRAFEFFREKEIYEERMMRKANSFAFKEPIFSDCGVNGGQIVIAPDGKVGVCYDFIKSRKYFGNDIQSDPNYDPFKAGLYDGWKNRSPFFMEQCYDCKAIALCGGGCPASIELQTGNRWNIDERICPHSKLTLEWLIWDTYKNTVA